MLENTVPDAIKFFLSLEFDVHKRKVVD